MSGRSAASLEGISKSVPTASGPLQILRDLSLEVERGEFLAVVGPSGAGKSTLLNILGLLDVPTGGRYTLAGVDVGRLRERQLTRLRRDHISFIFQAYHLLPAKTVLQNIELGLACQHLARRDKTAAALSAAHTVGLDGRLTAFPPTLSGGEQQRVAVARALARRSTLILADEPTGNLDAANADRVIELLSGTLRVDSALVVVTHDPRVAAAADRIVQLAPPSSLPWVA